MLPSRGMSTGMATSPARHPAGDGLLGTFADLELEAEGLHLDQRATDAADLGTAEYAGVTLVGRLLGSVGVDVVLRLHGGLAVSGRLARATEGFVIVDGAATWLVPAGAVVTCTGLSGHSVPEEARTVLARLSLASALRRLADERAGCRVHLRDGSHVEGSVLRVGADFVELAGARTEVVPLPAIAAVQEHR